MLQLLASMDLKDWIDIGLIISGVIVSTVMLRLRSVFVSKRGFSAWLKAHNEAHDKIDARLEKGDGKFSSIETALGKLATAEQLNELRLNLAAVKGELTQLEERIEGNHQVNLRTERMVNTLHNYLLQQSGG